MIDGNHFYETSDLKLAAFLLTNDVVFHGLKWDAKRTQATFLFAMPPDDVLAEWMKGKSDFLDQYQKARNILRDKVEEER
jgi:hypothetical protein